MLDGQYHGGPDPANGGQGQVKLRIKMSALPVGAGKADKVDQRRLQV